MARTSKPKELGAAMQQALLRIEKLEAKQKAILDWIDVSGDLYRPRQERMAELIREARYDSD